MRFQKITPPLTNTYFLLRHGQTDANNRKVYMGRGLDVDLNETGKQQAMDVVLDTPPDIILYSPLKRTQQTAKLVARKFGLEHMVSDDRLLEKNGGDIEGMPYAEIAANYPDCWNIWENNPLEYIAAARFPNGESDLDTAERIEDLLADLENTYQNKNILLVTHSGVMQAARYLFGKPKDDIYFVPVTNGGVEVYGNG